jgi:hypothetical protein
VISLTDLDRRTLAVLGREWLLHGHLQDRVGMALVMEHADREVMQQVAIEEWMAASPIYSLRMQQALNFPGHGVDTIFKNLQLDIGAPHEFMDFRFRLDDAEHGEFWLDHCGALMDVEPMGEDFVHGMCHTIEDPTFDATAAATNPHAQVRPVHRPPRRPADRTPHCLWRVDIVPDGPAAQPHPNQALVERSQLARVGIDHSPSGSDTNGLADYGGEFVPDFRLELLSHSALLVALQEFAVQSHLLLRGFLLSVSHRLGSDVAVAATPRLIGGWSGLTAQRIRAALELPDTIEGLASMLALHPMLAPKSYVGTEVELVDGAVRLSFGDCPAAEEVDGLTWFSGLGGNMDAAIDAIVAAYHPQARCRPVAPGSAERFAYEVRIDAASPPRAEPDELAIAKISTGARFDFRDGRRLLPLTPV